jgi:hypothetical protein
MWLVDDDVSATTTCGRSAVTVRSSVGRRAVSGALALAALAVGGCSAQSGAAAVVDGRPISIADLHAATDQLAPFLQDATPAGVLVVLIAEPTFQRVATEHGAGVSTQQAQALLDDLAAQGEGEAPEFSDSALAVARFTLLQQGLQQLPDGQDVIAQVSEELAELDVDVNPRFGQVDFAAGGITPVVHPWLVPDAAEEP